MSDLILPLIVLAAYAIFVWWVWRERNGLSWARGGPLVGRSRSAAQERVLFVCTHNSARSQMAEALLRKIAGDRYYVASGGTSPTNVHPLAELAMAERGLSLRAHWAKSVNEMGTRWDYVITVCDSAFERCPDYPAKTSRLHWSIRDPSSEDGAPTERLEAFRRVRDDLAGRIGQWVADRRET